MNPRQTVGQPDEKTAEDHPERRPRPGGVERPQAKQHGEREHQRGRRHRQRDERGS